MFDHLVTGHWLLLPLIRKKKRLKIYLPCPNTKADNCRKEQNNCFWFTLASSWALHALHRLLQVGETPQVQVRNGESITDRPTPSYLRAPPADMPISHSGLTFSPVVTLHVEWWKMLTKNRSSSTLGQVPHRLRVSKPLPTAHPVHARTALRAFYILRSSINPHSHSEVGNWGTEKLRNSQGPSSSVWLLSPRSSPLPVLLCLGPACLSYLYPSPLCPSSPEPYFPHVGPALEMLFPTLPVGGLFALFCRSALFFFFRERRFHTYHNFNMYDAYVCWLIFLSRLDNVLCAGRDTSICVAPHWTPNAKHNAWLQEMLKFLLNDW